MYEGFESVSVMQNYYKYLDVVKYLYFYEFTYEYHLYILYENHTLRYKQCRTNFKVIILQLFIDILLDFTKTRI